MAIAKGRWATILKETGEVSNVALMDGGVQPEVNVDAQALYTFEEVDEGVMIGMVRGGPIASVGGFGWREGESAGGRFGPGVARAAARPAIDETALPAVDHDRKVRGSDEPQPASQPAPTPTPAPVAPVAAPVVPAPVAAKPKRRKPPDQLHGAPSSPRRTPARRVTRQRIGA